MSKFNHTNQYVWKYKHEDFTVSYNFSNDLSSAEDIIAVTASCYNDNGDDVTSTLISSVAASAPDSMTFIISDGQPDTSYEIKITALGSGGNRYVHYVNCDVFGSISLNYNLADPSANSYVSLPEANSYIKNVKGHSSDWDTLSLEGKKRLLIQACKDINRFSFIGEKYYDNQALHFPESDHDVVSGDCATPLTINSFKNTSLTSDTYGAEKSNTDYWKYGTVHIVSGTPLNDIRSIRSSNITTDIITVFENFTSTPTANTSFKAFSPLHQNIKDAQVEQVLYLLESTGNNTIYSYKNMGAKTIWIGDVRVEFKDKSSSEKVPLSTKARKLLSRWIRRDIRIGRG